MCPADGSQRWEPAAHARERLREKRNPSGSQLVGQSFGEYTEQQEQQQQQEKKTKETGERERDTHTFPVFLAKMYICVCTGIDKEKGNEIGPT